MIVYLSKSEKGLIGKAAYGKILFPDRKSNLHAGFVKVEDTNAKDNYAFIKGENINSIDFTENDLKALAIDVMLDVRSICKAKTKDGIEGVLLSPYAGESKFGTFHEGTWHFLSLGQIDPSYKRSIFSDAVKVTETLVSNEEIIDLRMLYTGKGWGVTPSSHKNLENVPEWVNKGLEVESLTFAYLCNTYNPRYVLYEYLTKNYAEHLPLVIHNFFRHIGKKDVLLENVKKYNIEKLTWWKETGLSTLPEQEMQDALVHAFSLHPYWETI
jgi:hypothetical protein